MKKIYDMDRPKAVPVFKKGKVVGFREMKRSDVARYFGPLRNGSGTSCERCGMLIGPSKFHTETYTFVLEKLDGYGMPFDLCGSCYEDKTASNRECTPDIEDIIRHNVEL